MKEDIDNKTDNVNPEQGTSNEVSSLKEAIVQQATEEEAPLSKNFTLKKILGGDILSAKAMRQQIWLIILIVFFLIIYISNRYSVQKDLIKIDELQNELQDAKYKALSSGGVAYDALGNKIIKRKIDGITNKTSK